MLALLFSMVLVGSCETTAEPEPLPTGSPPGPGALRVVAAGDISDCTPAECVAADTAGVVTELDPDLVLTLGDTQYESGTTAEYEAEYDRTWGRFLDITRPAVGNHEYETPGAQGYFDYFGSRAAPDTDGYYSFDAEAWHLVALNTNNACQVVACDDGSEQQQWLAADLADTSRRCALAYMHHPRWSTGEHLDIEAVDALWRTAVEGGVDLVLAGHDHNYERFVPLDADGTEDSEGAAQLVVGTGGTELRDFAEAPRAETANRFADAHGVLELELGRSSYSWRFVGTEGQVRDRGGPVDCG
ncbi:MAG: metallophosphoesterase [Actinomycetota bacterium]|nr:metallophosphoesterase [Actinomycetota bacterium]